MKKDRESALYKMKNAFKYWGESPEFWKEVKGFLREMESRIVKRYE